VDSCPRWEKRRRDARAARVPPAGAAGGPPAEAIARLTLEGVEWEAAQDDLRSPDGAPRVLIYRNRAPFAFAWLVCGQLEPESVFGGIRVGPNSITSEDLAKELRIPAELGHALAAGMAQPVELSEHEQEVVGFIASALMVDDGWLAKRTFLKLLRATSATEERAVAIVRAVVATVRGAVDRKLDAARQAEAWIAERSTLTPAEPESAQ
jgi:hypothetical protein